MWIRSLLRATVFALLPAAALLAQEADTRSPGEPADWLVTRAGERIEIDGPWRLEGERVYFRTSAGTLSVIRASELDLEASRWPEAQVPVVREPEPDPEPVLVLENGGTRSAGDEQQSETTAAGQPASPPTASEPGASSVPSFEAPTPETTAGSGTQLEVASWTDVSETAEEVHIYGTVRNGSRRPVSRLRVQVNLLDETGAVLASKPARLTRRQVDRNATVNFQVYFGQFLPYSEVDFVIEGR